MTALQIVAAVICLGVTAVAVALLVKTVNQFIATFRLGQPDYRGDAKGARTATLFREFLGHTRMSRLPVVAAAHWVTMIGFGFLFFTLLTAFGQLFKPDFALPLIGHFPPYEWVTEVLAWTGLVAILLLIAIRQRNHPRSAAGEGGRRSRFFGSTFWQAYYVELTILGVMLCILALRAFEYALEQGGGTTGTTAVGDANSLHYPLTGWMGESLNGLSIDTLEQTIVVIAAVKILISFAWMITIALNPTMGVAWHRFLAFFNIFYKRHADGRTSLAELQPIRIKGEILDFEKVDELDEDAALGVGKIEDFTWKGLLDFTTCTECGRCQSQCPAWNTDKPLSPKLLVMTLRDHAYAKSPWLLASEEVRAQGIDAAVDAGIGGSGAITVETKQALAVEQLVGETGYDITRPLTAYNPYGTPEAGAVIDDDVLWSCTTCGACVEQCPVDIEHVDAIVDLRRYKTLIESAFPSELNGLFKNLEKNSNPWGLAPRLRMDWAKDLPFEVPQVGQDVEDLADVDYLFWVGCAGAYEDRAKKTTRAVAELLHTAGVSFAVLGDGEACTGDPARRSGNEFLFQMLAQQNVEVLNEVGATKIVVTCAHCFNTLKNEYPQLGGNYEVLHHTQLLNRLVREKRLTPVARPGEAVAAGAVTGAASTGTKVTYHDPCYLGRHNQVYAPPRELIATLPGVEFAEMPRNKEKSFCCGAGGARMWMEEKLGTRINTNRTEEALATGADRIAIGCPFCKVMLTDGLNAAKHDGKASEDVEVVDIAQMLLAAVRRGDDGGQPAVEAEPDPQPEPDPEPEPAPTA